MGPSWMTHRHTTQHLQDLFHLRSYLGSRIQEWQPFKTTRMCSLFYGIGGMYRFISVQILHPTRTGNHRKTQATLHRPTSLTILQGHVARRCVIVLRFQGPKHGTTPTRAHFALEKP